MNFRCRRFGSIFRRYDRCCCRSCCRWRSIDRDRRIQQTLARNSVFAIVFVCFSGIKKCLGRTETRIRERMYYQSIRTVWYISLHNRAKAATYLKAPLHGTIRPHGACRFPCTWANRSVWHVARMSRTRENRVKRNYSSFYVRTDSAARAVRLPLYDYERETGMV